jgi:hypothetical protein
MSFGGNADVLSFHPHCRMGLRMVRTPENVATTVVLTLAYVSLLVTMKPAIAQEMEFSSRNQQFTVVGTPDTFFRNGTVVDLVREVKDFDAVTILLEDGSFTPPVPLDRLDDNTKMRLAAWIENRLAKVPSKEGAEIVSESIDEKTMVQMGMKNPVVRLAFPRIMQFYSDYRNLVNSQALNKIQYDNLKKQFQKDVGKRALADPFVQYLVALVESDAGLDSSSKFMFIVKKYPDFWDAWKCYVVSTLVYDNSLKSVQALRRFENTLVAEAKKRLSIPYNKETADWLSDAAHAIAWVEDTADIFMTLEGREASLAQQIQNDSELDRVATLIEQYDPAKNLSEQMRLELDARNEKIRAEKIDRAIKEGFSLIQEWDQVFTAGLAGLLDAFARQSVVCDRTATVLAAAESVLRSAESALSSAESELRSAENKSEDDSDRASAIANAKRNVESCRRERSARSADVSRASSIHRSEMETLRSLHRQITIHINSFKNLVLQFEVSYAVALEASADLRVTHYAFKEKVAIALTQVPQMPTIVFGPSDRQKRRLMEIELAQRIQLDVEGIFASLQGKLDEYDSN